MNVVNTISGLVRSNKKWIEYFDSVYEKYGSWETKKNYTGIRFKEVA